MCESIIYTIYEHKCIKSHMKCIIIVGNNFNFSYIPTNILQLELYNNCSKQHKNLYYLPYSIQKFTYTDDINLNIDKLPPNILKIFIKPFKNINNLPPFIQTIILLIVPLCTIFDYNNLPLRIKYLYIDAVLDDYIYDFKYSVLQYYNNVVHLALLKDASFLVSNLNKFPNVTSLYFEHLDYLIEHIHKISKSNKLEHIIIDTTCYTAIHPNDYTNNNSREFEEITLLNNCKSLKQFTIIISTDLNRDIYFQYFTRIFKKLLLLQYDLNIIDNNCIYEYFDYISNPKIDF